jgi:hypothetical protein
MMIDDMSRTILVEFVLWFIAHVKQQQPFPFRSFISTFPFSLFHLFAQMRSSSTNDQYMELNQSSPLKFTSWFAADQ